MEQVWKIIAAIIAIAGFGWTVHSYTSFANKLEQRIETLETQIKSLAVAPAIVRKEPETTSPSQNPSTSNANTAAGETSIGNPLIQICTDLIKRAAGIREKGYGSSGLDSLMKDYGCAELMKNLASQSAPSPAVK